MGFWIEWMYPVFCPAIMKFRIGMFKNVLQLNDCESGKKDMITPCSPSKSTITSQWCSLDASTIRLMKRPVTIDVIFDPDLSFDAQAVKSSFAQLRHLTNIRSLLFSTDLQKVHPRLYFLQSWLLLCTLLWYQHKTSNIHRLQLKHNAAARLSTCSKRSNHITRVIAALQRQSSNTEELRNWGWNCMTRANSILTFWWSIELNNESLNTLEEKLFSPGEFFFIFVFANRCLQMSISGTY